jgi:hypothetical protein
MKPTVSLLLSVQLCVVSLVVVGGSTEGAVRIVVDSSADCTVKLAAEELKGYLAKLYPNDEFSIGEGTNPEVTAIYLGCSQEVKALLPEGKRQFLLNSEAYVVTVTKSSGKRGLIIAGADPGGVMHGVCALLRELGCGFYLSFDTFPPPKTGVFQPVDIYLSNRPLVPKRVVFNWHNFLSGCSTWNLKHWNRWTSQSQKMGYNGIMVHAYGNNPMAGFAFEGVQKPVGYLSSTQVGRDWSVNHVNDVRRLFGGHVFQSPVFGSDAAIEGSYATRTKAAQDLMAAVFEHAEQRGVDVYFAVDIDTSSANPQELITRLPEHSRFEIDVTKIAWMGQIDGKAWLVNPDTPEGYAFYKAQVKHFLAVYPQIDYLVAWHRVHNTPWMGFKVEEMPESWQVEYQSELAKTPDAAKLWHAPHMFAQAKIIRAFQRAVKELGRDDVHVAFGSWNFDFLPGADRFLPKGVTLIALDWNVLRDASIFDTAERRASVAAVASHRPVIPVAWAHHDDGNYVGRPYTPYSNFHDRLTEMKCESGFGIIHWTTKPLDIYFRSLSDQVWSNSKNVHLETACRQMAEHLVGQAESKAMAAYLEAWVTTMPKIGRATSDFFIDHELKDLPGVEAAYRERLTLLEAVNRSRVSPAGQEWLDYFTGLEHYVLEVYRTENAFNRAKKAYADDDLKAARRAIAECRPEDVIQRYAEFSKKGGLTRGEEGLIVSMNTRWLPHYTRFRQQLGLEAVCYNFGPTSHDMLAQSRGVFTYHFGPNQAIWQTLGVHETKRPEVRIPGDVQLVAEVGISDAEHEVGHSGVRLDAPWDFVVTPILKRDSRRQYYKSPGDLPPGRYRLDVLTTAQADAVVELKIAPTSGATVSRKMKFDVDGPKQRLAKHTCDVQLTKTGNVTLAFTPKSGQMILCGLRLTPIAVEHTAEGQ